MRRERVDVPGPEERADLLAVHGMIGEARQRQDPGEDVHPDGEAVSLVGRAFLRGAERQHPRHLQRLDRVVRRQVVAAERPGGGIRVPSRAAFAILPPATVVVAMSSTKGGSVPAGTATVIGFVSNFASRPWKGTTPAAEAVRHREPDQVVRERHQRVVLRHPVVAAVAAPSRSRSRMRRRAG